MREVFRTKDFVSSAGDEAGPVVAAAIANNKIEKMLMACHQLLEVDLRGATYSDLILALKDLKISMFNLSILSDERRPMTIE